MVAPALEKIAKDYDGKLTVAKVNTDEKPGMGITLWSAGNSNNAFSYLKVKLSTDRLAQFPEGMLRETVDQFLGVIKENKE